MSLTPFFDNRIADWVAQRVPGCERGFAECKAMGVERDGQIVGGIVFHDWSPEHRGMEVSAAAIDPRWLTRSILNTAFKYIFEDLGCQMVMARQDPGNRRAVRLWKALGAEETIIPRLRGRDKAGSIVTLTDDAWSRSRFKR